VLEVKQGWHESARCYVGVVEEPGSKKSPAYKIATDPLRHEQERLARQYDNAVELWKMKVAQYEVEKARWDKALKSGTAQAEDKPELPEEPIMEQIFTTDATMEALLALLARRPRGLIFLQDELTGWVRAMNQYR